MFKKRSRKIYFLVFVVPTLIAFMIGFIYPFFQGIYLSFCKFRTTSNATWVGFDNYIKAFQNESFIRSFWFTALFVVVSVILINAIALCRLCSYAWHKRLKCFQNRVLYAKPYRRYYSRLHLETYI